MRAILLATALAALSSTATLAAVFTVTNNNDSGAGSLRAAVAASASGDTVIFDPAVKTPIVLTSGQISITHALTITGPGWRQLQIEGNFSDRIFEILEAAPASCPAPTAPLDYVVTISGLGLGNGRRNTDSPGGAINAFHSLHLDSVVIYDSAARDGGGIDFHLQYAGQSLSITNSVLVDNMARPLSATNATIDGGGLRVVDYFVGSCGSADFTRFAPAPTVTIANTVFAGNRAQPVAGSGRLGRGGAIFAVAYADITITDSRIVDNHVDVPIPPDPGLFYQGGAFFGAAKSLTFVRAEISDNSVSPPGVSALAGGFFVANTASTFQAPADAMVVKVIDSTVSGNTAGNLAGIHVFGNVALELDNSTVDNNVSGTGAGGVGGIYVNNGVSSDGVTNCTPPTLTMTSSILANSGAAPRLDLRTNTAAPGLASFTVNADHSLIQTPCPFCNFTVLGSNNLPQGTDPMLGPLALNGGITRTQPPLPGSPVIDTGSNPLALTADQRGSPRVVGTSADMGAFESVFIPARLLVPDGTSIKQTFGAYPDTKWFALGVEPGKTYAIEVADVDGDLTANAFGTLGLYDVDGVSPPPEASVDCTAANGRRPPAVDVAGDGIRCILRTAPAAFALFLNKRPVYVKATRKDPASGGGSQFKIRAREATVYGRWLTAGNYDFHVEVENTTGDAMCVEVARYPAAGLGYAPYGGWDNLIDVTTLTVPSFGAVKTVMPRGSNVDGDMEGALRIGACGSPVNLIPGALHVSTYAFDPVSNTYIYYFTSTANDGKTRSTW